MQYWHLSLRDEVTLNCAHTHALHSAVRPRRGTHSLWRQTGNQANKPGFYTHLYFLACIIIDRDRDTEQLPFSRWRQGPNKNVKIYYKWTIRLLLSVIECTIYISESCGSKQLEKKNHRIFLSKSSLLSRMTFRNNSWHPIRVAQTSRLPLGQTEGLQIKRSHYLPIQQSQQRCANACFTCRRHTDIPPFCQSTNVCNLSAPHKNHPSIKLYN